MLIFGRLPRYDELRRFSELLTANELPARRHETSVQSHPARRPADGHPLAR